MKKGAGLLQPHDLFFLCYNVLYLSHEDINIFLTLHTTDIY